MEFNQTGNLNAARRAARAAAMGRSNTEVQEIAEASAYGLPISKVIITVESRRGTIVTPNTNRTPGNTIVVETVMSYEPLGMLHVFLPGAKVNELRASASFQID